MATTKKNSKINGKEYYRIRRKVAETIKDGKTVPVLKSFYGTSKRNAEQQYELWREAQRNINVGSKYTSDSTLGHLAEYYIENVLKVSRKYAEGTRIRYTGSYNNYVKTDSVICAIKASDIRPIDVQLYYNRLACTTGTIKAVHKFMATFFKWLSLNGYCEYVLNAVEIPIKETAPVIKEVTVWTDEELDTIVNHLTGYRLRFFIILAIATGLRIGELFGLKYSDFGDVLKVERQYQWNTLIPPKSNSHRVLPLHPMVVRELGIHKAWHTKEMKLRKYDSDFVFTSQYGTLLEYANVRRSINRYYNRIDIEPKKFHCYRSTFCTNLCKAGVPIQVASDLMGHKSIEVTAKHYTSIGREEKLLAIETLPDIALKI